MYKAILYFILIMLYLGLSKILSPSEYGIQYLQNEKYFEKIFPCNQTDLMLIDYHSTGIFIQTYYQKYRLIQDGMNTQEVIVRTSKEFLERNLKNIGLSLYRCHQEEQEFTPTVPGIFYLGKKEFGRWVNEKWKFNRTYKNLPYLLGWGDFVPTLDFYLEAKTHLTIEKPFYGQDHQFGTNGGITRNVFSTFRDKKKKKINFKELMFEYVKENFRK